MHAPSQFLLDGLELRPHSIAPGLPHDEELTLTGALTDEGEAEDVEGLRLAEPASSASIGGLRWIGWTGQPHDRRSEPSAANGTISYRKAPKGIIQMDEKPTT